ncbi:hypothetical protein PRZ48_002496 [Zasmidium cellare]|uniref:FAD-binding domain-containing protein n=1 Tax=Zasmidium cellare TaxID=395010 RepID=A0ABR0F4D1_ZASCE|nr:hypothetical protein PRZ48_002496 [Zasmidium cellare]
MHALSLQPHLDAHIFEAAPTFRESGLAIGIAHQAQEALELIGPSAIQALRDSGAVPSNGTWFMVGTGPDAGMELDAIDKAEMGRVESITQRAPFLKALLADAPARRMHANKRLAKIEQADHSVVLTFDNGSMHECDVLIGAGGIGSFVRKYVLGEDDPAVKPQLTGWYSIRAMVPYEQAREVLGPDLIDLDRPREVAWLGDGTWIMHNISDGGRLALFVTCIWGPETVQRDTWMREIDVEVETKKFEGWPRKFQKAWTEFFEKAETRPTAYYMRDHAHARTQGSGGGMSLEDALILSRLLSKSSTRDEAALALEVYNEIRLPRTQGIVDSSKAAGLLMTGRGPEGTDFAESKGQIRQRWDHILHFDNKKSVEEAENLLEERLRKGQA